jgi:hypothetical protein
MRVPSPGFLNKGVVVLDSEMDAPSDGVFQFRMRDVVKVLFKVVFFLMRPLNRGTGKKSDRTCP